MEQSLRFFFARQLHSPIIPTVFHFSNGTRYYVPYTQEDSHFLKMSTKWMFVIHYLLYGIMANKIHPTTDHRYDTDRKISSSEIYF